jgi:opacity protein-like surface antigen
MHHRKRFGCQVYPLLFLILLAVPGLRAQNPTDTSSQAPAPAQTEPENPQQNQVRLAQEAQARIRARRQQRTQRVVQDTYSHKFEVYGGGGYTRFRPGGSLQHINESAWNVGFTDYLRPRLGITADLRGYYGVAFIPPNPFNIFKPSISQYTFMAGPQYRFVRREHWAISAQGLVGVAKGNFNASNSGVPLGTQIGLWSNGTNFSAAVGVPVDYNLSPALAVRLQPGYWLTTFGGTAQAKNLGFNIGIVYRFGRQ